MGVSGGVDSADSVSAADPAETEWQPTLQYFPLPPSATPLNNLLPFGGVGASPRLMKETKGQVFEHDINMATRELDARYSNTTSTWRRVNST